MKVLITGATGFVGQNLLPMIEEKCHNVQVMTLDRNIEKAKGLFPYSNCKQVKSTDWEAVKAFDPEIVLHLAAYNSSGNDDETLSKLLATNIEYGVYLLQSLCNCKSLKLFVNTGTFAEYRFGAEAFDDAYLYSATKTAYRAFVKYYADLCGYHYINVVPYTIYGGKKTVKRLIDYIFESIESETPVDMTAGEQILDFTHVNDLCDFYVTCINQVNKICSLKQGENFHIGTGKGNTPKDVITIIERVTNKKCNINWGGRPYRERDTMQAVAPIAKNIELLGWKAKISLEQGLSMMLR